VFALAFASSNDPVVVLVVFFGGGLVLFLLGLRTYRRYRLMEGTTLEPIRSITMGLVHVHGKAEGDDRLTSPLTHTPCFYYKVEVDKWEERVGEDSASWHIWQTDTAERRFYLQDETGKVLVDPQHANFDVPCTFQGEVGSKRSTRPYIDPTLGVAAPTPEELYAYLSQRLQQTASVVSSLPSSGAQTEHPLLGKGLQGYLKVAEPGVTSSARGVSIGPGGGRYRFTEHCLIAGHEHNILGTCSENPSPREEHDRNLISKGQNQPTFIITSKTEEQIEKSLKRKALIMMAIGALVMILMVAFALYDRGML